MSEITAQWEDFVRGKQIELNEKLKLDLAIVSVSHIASAINSKLEELKDQRAKLG